MQKFWRTIKKASKKLIAAVICFMVLIVVISAIVGAEISFGMSDPEIISVTTLEKIIEISELSTYRSVYNGVATVMNNEDPSKVDYHVSYAAEVNAGLDFEEIDISIDYDKKVIYLTIPEIKIINTSVDIASMDFIFQNKNANTATITEEAYRACKEDIAQESQSQQAIYKLAKQNAENVLTALIKPVISQLDGNFTLEVS